jgi:hypothetical protein
MPSWRKFPQPVYDRKLSSSPGTSTTSPRLSAMSLPHECLIQVRGTGAPRLGSFMQGHVSAASCGHSSVFRSPKAGPTESLMSYSSAASLPDNSPVLSWRVITSATTRAILARRKVFPRILSRLKVKPESRSKTSRASMYIYHVPISIFARPSPLVNSYLMTLPLM